MMIELERSDGENDAHFSASRLNGRKNGATGFIFITFRSPFPLILFL